MVHSASSIAHYPGPGKGRGLGTFTRDGDRTDRPRDHRRHTLVRSLVAPLEEVPPDRINDVLAGFRSKAEEILAAEGVPSERRDMRRLAADKVFVR